MIINNPIIIGCLLPLLLASCGSSHKATSQDNTIIVINTQKAAPATTAETVTSNKTYTDLQVKYAGYLNVTPEKITNTRLYTFIDEWLYTPYKWGGMDKHGIDCSAFMQKLLQQVYNIHIPRTSVDQFFHDWVDRFGSAEYLAEGDLVFFKTIKGKLISHVGLYLGNRMFVNSSSSKGVSIGNLDDPYWKAKYVAAGRLKRS
jgi:murein DD-endopeptidase / murein LD-carboxypeptidase